MSQIELIETFDPQPEAMVHSFHCAVCDKQHLQTGTLARVWVLFQEGYATQASPAGKQGRKLTEHVGDC